MPTRPDTTSLPFCLQVQDEAGVYGVVLVAPSVTPFGHINPSFRTFTMDAHSKQLLSYTQYHLDLPLANGMWVRALSVFACGDPLPSWWMALCQTEVIFSRMLTFVSFIGRLSFIQRVPL